MIISPERDGILEDMRYVGERDSFIYDLTFFVRPEMCIRDSVTTLWKESCNHVDCAIFIKSIAAIFGN